MTYYSNGLPMNPALKFALDAFIAKAHAEGSTATDEEIFAAFEVTVMDAAGIPVSKRTRNLAANFENELASVYDGTAL